MSSVTETNQQQTNAFNGQAQPAKTITNSSSNAFKRKFEDALHTLDEAVGNVDSNPPPSKRFKVGRSLYSTLAKYGIRKDPKTPSQSMSDNSMKDLSKTAPNLTRILSRTATRTRKALPFKFGHTPSAAAISASSNSEYRPSSTSSFLARLATFKLSTYANKPNAIDAVAASKCGWVNDGKDRLVCGICNASWVVAGKEGMSRDAAIALVEKQRAYLVDMHKNGCPWKSKQCDASIYHVPLSTPSTMARELNTRAHRLDSVMKDVQIKHPLTAAQIQNLLNTIASVKFPQLTVPAEQPSSVSEAGSPPPSPGPFVSTEPSESAILTALFGWDLVQPQPRPERSRTPSLSRANSAITSISAMPTRSQRTAASVGPDGREATPASSPSRPSLSHRPDTTPTFFTSSTALKPESALLHCSLCQRRVGLWAFMPSDQSGAPGTPSPAGSSRPSQPQARRSLDVLKEHRSYCPYVVKSSVVPFLPVTTGPGRTSPTSLANGSLQNLPGNAHNEIEGWRAVLTVVTRYGSLQRQRLGTIRRSTETAQSGTETQPSEDVPAEGDEVQAMVEGVKKHGGRDLLRYVKGLLG